MKGVLGCRHLFHFFSLGMTGTSRANYSRIIRTVVPGCSDTLVTSLEALAAELTALSDNRMNDINCKLSLRQMLRICRRSLHFPDETASTIAKAILLSFVPAAEQQVRAV